MSSLISLGLRNERDIELPDSDYLIGALSLLQEILQPDGQRFFFDTTDGMNDTIDGSKVVDLYGWIVPLEAVDSFEPRWQSWEDADSLADLDSLGVDYVGITWQEGADGKPEPVIDRG